MGHDTHHHGHHGSAGASARLVVSCLILFFTLSALGHYVFVVRTAHEAPPHAAAQEDHAAPAAGEHGGETDKRPENNTPHKKKH